jgi:low temperature requirement protein LtrA
VVRLVIFAAMAAMLIVSLCVQEAFGNLALTFALAIGFFRTAHIALFWLAGADDKDLRRSVIGLGVSTAVAVGILLLASLFDGLAQGRSGHWRSSSTWPARTSSAPRVGSSSPAISPSGTG